MTDHPIIFSSRSVQATLADLKTQTRRVIKTKVPIQDGWRFMTCMDGMNEKHRGMHIFASDEVILKQGRNRTEYFNCPFGKVGDRLWVKEAYQILRTWYNRKLVEGVYINHDQTQVDDPFDTEGNAIRLTDAEWARYSKRKWPHQKMSARFMYKSLARIWLEITSIRPEKLQDISEEDAWWVIEFKVIKKER